MKTLKVMRVSFDLPIKREEIAAFRGALAHKVGLEHEWFHNHNNAEGAQNGYHYRYARVQYKYHNGYPLVVFLEDGVAEAHRLFAQSD